MEQSSNYFEKENDEMLNSLEAARMIEYLRAIGLNDTQICDCVTYVATGVGLPVRNDEEKPEE